MRQIQDSLYALLKDTVVDLVQHQRQNNRRRESDQQVQSIQHQSIHNAGPEVRCSENFLEYIEADPFTIPNT